MPLGEGRSSCYACHDEGVSDEHAPPRVIFPKGHRSDLIAVRSCAAHNQGKSIDDEYLACVLAINSESPVAKGLFEGPRVRAMLRNDASLGQRFFAGARPVTTVVDREETLAISYEMDRIHRSVRLMARALHLQCTGEKWLSDLDVKCVNTHLVAGRASELTRIEASLDAYARVEALAGARRGANPHVFWFQLARSGRRTFMLLVFYGDMRFLVWD